MMEFNKGDKVTNVDGSCFSNGEKVLTVERVEVSSTGSLRVWLEETKTHTNARNVKLVALYKNEIEAAMEEKISELKEELEGLESALRVLKSFKVNR